MKSVEIVLKTDGARAAQVLVAGTDITQFVREIHASVPCDAMPTVRAELIAREGFDVTLDAHVYVTVSVPKGCTLEVGEADGRLRYHARPVSEAAE
ncbi:hypothetical protein [Luteitalea sp.]